MQRVKSRKFQRSWIALYEGTNHLSPDSVLMCSDHTEIAYGITRKRENSCRKSHAGKRSTQNVNLSPRNGVCVHHSCGEENSFTSDDFHVRHRDDVEDLAGRSDGNMRTVIDRASNRRNFTPTNYKWRKYPSRFAMYKLHNLSFPILECRTHNRRAYF